MHKKEIRVLGIDDGPFTRKDSEVLVVGSIYRGGQSLDGVISTKIDRDGNNSTEKLIQLINKTKFKPQLQCIFLNGIALGGFNVIDIKELNKKTRIPIIVIIRRKPDLRRIQEVLKKINQEEKIRLIEKAGEIHPINKIFVQLAGISLEEAKSILRVSVTKSNIPESLRMSHIIAAGIVLGESKGKA